jgi:hypothetical protein
LVRRNDKLWISKTAGWCVDFRIGIACRKQERLRSECSRKPHVEWYAKAGWSSPDPAGEPNERS